MSKKKKNIDQWMRSLHRDLGYFTIGLTLIYALSGIVLSARGLGWFKQELNKQIIMETHIKNKEFNKIFIDVVKKGQLPIIFPKDSYKYLNRLQLNKIDILLFHNKKISPSFRRAYLWLDVKILLYFVKAIKASLSISCRPMA